MTSDSVKAEEIASELVTAWLRPVPGRTPISLSERTKAELINSIATALHSARRDALEAAAKVAEQCADGWAKFGDSDGSTGRAACSEVARRLRETGKPPTPAAAAWFDR